MQRTAQIAMTLLGLVEVEIERGREAESGKGIVHGRRPPRRARRLLYFTVNEWPQPQLVASFGFLNLKPWNIRVFSKSSTEPAK